MSRQRDHFFNFPMRLSLVFEFLSQQRLTCGKNYQTGFIEILSVGFVSNFRSLPDRISGFCPFLTI